MTSNNNWYRGGLAFACQGCGNCCSGPVEGYVWVNREKIVPKYAVRVLNSSQTRRYYFEVLKQQCGMATLNQRHVRSIPMPIPPLPEQLRIVAYLDDLQAKVDTLNRLQAETAAELEAMLPSILDKAFKGEL